MNVTDKYPLLMNAFALLPLQILMNRITFGLCGQMIARLMQMRLSAMKSKMLVGNM